MNSDPSTSSEEPDEYKKISALSQPELTLMGNLEDVDVSPDLFEKAKKACVERIGAILEFSKGGPLGGDESSGIYVLDQNQLRQIEEWQNDNFSVEASERPDESSIVEPSDAPGPSEGLEDNIGNLDSVGSSEDKEERQTGPEVFTGSQGSDAIFPGPENQEPALPIPAKRRPGRPKKEKNLNLDFIEPMDLEIPATLVTNGTDNSQKSPAEPAEASEPEVEPALAEQAPKPACGHDKLPVKEKIVEKEIEDQAGTSGPSDKLVEQGNIQKEEKVDQKMDHGSSRRKKKQKTETEKLREMDFGPKAGGSLQDIEDRSSREKQWTKEVQLDQRRKLEESMDHPKLSKSNRVAKKSNDLEPAVPSGTSNSLAKDLPEGSEVSDQLVNLDGPVSMDLDLDAPNSTFEASMASDSPVEEPLVSVDPPNSTSITSSSPVQSLPDDSDPLVDLDESEAIPEVPSFTNRRSTVQEDPEPLVKPAMTKDDPPGLPIRVATPKTKRNVLLDIPNPSKRAKVQVSSIVESSDAPGPSEASEGNIGNLDSAEKAPPESSDDRSDPQETQTESEAVPGYEGSKTVSVDRVVQVPTIQRPENQGSEAPIPVKRRPGRPRKEKNLNSEDKEPEAREPEIPATPVTNGTQNSQKSPTKPAEASEPPAEPAPKPAYGPSTKIKEIPEWIRKYEVHEEDLPRHGKPWLFSVDHYRPGGPKAPDPRLKLREQDIETIRRKCGYDKLPVKEKRVEKEKEDQAGISGSSDRLVEQESSQRKMDRGSEGQGSKDQGSVIPVPAKRCPGRPRKEHNQAPKLNECNDLEPAVSSGASNSLVKDLPEGSEVSDQLVNLDGPESMDLDRYVPNSTSDATMASNSPVAEPLVKLDATNTISMTSGSSVQDLPDDSDSLVDLEESEAIPEVSSSTHRRSTVQEDPESLAKSATPKDDTSELPIRVATPKTKRNVLLDIPNPSKRAKVLVPSIAESSDAPGLSEASEGNIGNLDSREKAHPDSSDGTSDLQETQTEPEAVPGSQGSKTVIAEGSVRPIPAKRRPGRPRKGQNLKSANEKSEVRDPDFIEPVDLESLPTWNGMDNSFPDFDEPGPVPSIVKPSVVEIRRSAGSKGSTKTAPCPSEASEGRSEVQRGPKPVQGSKTMLVDQRSKDQRSVIPMPAKRRPGRPRKEQNLNSADEEPEARDPDIRVPVDMPVTRITKLTSPASREVPKTRVTRITRLLSLPPRIDTPDQLDLDQASSSNGPQRLVPSKSQQGPSRGVTSKPQTKWRRNAIIRKVKTSHRKKTPDAVEDSESDDDVEKEKPVCKWNNCGTIFSKNKKFYKHVKNHVHRDKIIRRNVDSGPTELYKCQWAGCSGTVPFDSHKKIVHHMREHTNENRGGRPLGSFKTGRNQKKTSEAVEDSESDDDAEEEKPECEWNSCGKVFTKNERFYEHVEKHVRKDELRNPTGFYKCRWAGCYRTEPFDEYYKLRYHMRRHTGEKPFKCETCGSRFVRQEGLKNHMRTHTGEKPYKCKVCETTFTTCSDRHSHSKQVHGEKKSTPVKYAKMHIPIHRHFENTSSRSIPKRTRNFMEEIINDS
ncbi:unnamed protein product [Caenorhabditis nigoni]